MSLAPYASDPQMSRGRLIAEKPSPTRSDFQRDRDRVIHSTAFRRLKHKTQVFLYHEGDHYRTRLTHSLEVAQVARSLARGLNLNEDLAEALALAHDLGHPPFGHTGEEALARLMADHGGFDHNAQSLKIVTALEQRYADFDGLNLTWETLEGLVKHNGPLMDADGAGTVPAGIAEYAAKHDLWLSTHASAEAQVATIADDIAYNAHDIDDGLRAGLIDLDLLQDMPIAGSVLAEVVGRYPNLERSRIIHEVLRRVLTWMIEDVFTETETRMVALTPRSADDIRRASRPVVAFTESMLNDEAGLKAKLFAHVYRHPRILAVRANADQIVDDLFNRYSADPAALPAQYQEMAVDCDERTRVRLICDFIAGMTDRFAVQEHRRLFANTPELR